MPMDRSTKINPRGRAPNGLGGAGNSLGPRSMVSGPVGTLAVNRGASTNMARPSGKAIGSIRGRGEGTDNKLVRDPGPIVFKQNLAGQTFNFANYFSNARLSTASTFALSAAPTGMTLDTTTGILSGTPTTVQAITPTITVVSAKTPDDPNLVVTLAISVVA